MSKATTFGAENQPENRRGRSFKTKLLEVIREESMIGSSPEDSPDKAEKLFISNMAKRAFDLNDLAGATLLKELLSKTYPSLKSTMPNVKFEFSPESTPSTQAGQILKAAAEGELPPDVAQIFISSIASMMKIEEVTELSRRLAEIEKQLGL